MLHTIRQISLAFKSRLWLQDNIFMTFLACRAQMCCSVTGDVIHGPAALWEV